MKKFKTIFSTLVLSVAIAPAAFAQFAGGDGTAGSPYQITTAAELAEVQNYRTSDFILMNDIDLGGADWSPNVIGKNESAPYSGTFDGDGHKIQNVTYTGAVWFNGFFGCIGGGGTIKNLQLDINVVSTGTNVGGLVGGSAGGTIQNCTVSGSVAGNSADAVGGIIGYQWGGASAPLIITNCWVKATVSGVNNVGGIIGSCEKEVTIQNCAVSSAVTGSGSNVGGITGNIIWANNVIVQNCWVNTNIIAPASSGTGGIVGTCNNANAIVQQCIFDGAITSTDKTGGAIGHYAAAQTLTGLVVTHAAFTNSAGSTDNPNLGRIIGTFDGSGSVSNNFANATSITGITRTSTDIDRDGTDKTDADLKAKATYEGIGYAFGNSIAAPWAIDEGNSYPQLWFTGPYRVTFVVHGVGNAPINDAVVTLGGTTNAAGVYSFSGFTNGTYSYEVTKAGYTIVTGTVTITNADITGEDVELAIAAPCQVTFSVKDVQGNTINGAKITLGSTTNAANDYVFAGLPTDTYPYVVAQVGYDTVRGSITVTADTTHNITMYESITPATPAVGDGTSGSPYQITTTSELAFVSSNLNVHYILMNDIDLSGVAEHWTAYTIGTDETTPFTGTFDGNGYKIQNATITSSGTYTGFFNYIKGGTVKDLELENIHITGVANVGGLAGQTEGGTIQNCIVSGTIAASGDNVGGIVGHQDNVILSGLLTIENCWVKATVLGVTRTGGIIGFCEYEATVRNCAFSGASVTSTVAPFDGSVGGIVGRIEANNVTVQNCWANTNVIAANGYGTGGIVGVCNNGAAIVQQCIFGGAITSQDRTAGAIGWYAAAKTFTGLVVTHAAFTNGQGSAARLGRIIGSLDANGIGALPTSATISNNFANTTSITGITHASTDIDRDGTDKTDADLKAQATYEDIGYSFGGTPSAPWTIEEGNDYPQLWFMVDAQQLTFDVHDATPNPIVDAVVTLGDTTHAAGDYVFTVYPGKYNYEITKIGFTTVRGTVTVQAASVTQDITMNVGTSYYYITFAAGAHGSGTMAKDSVEAGTAYTAPACTFTPVGYYGFTAWKDGSNADYATGDSIPVSGSITLTAQWEAVGVPPTITTASLSSGTVGTAYNRTLTATGDATITWSITAGSLPAGLTLSAEGVISGTPTTAIPSATFTVKAENSAGNDTKQLSITITGGAPTAVETQNVAVLQVYPNPTVNGQLTIDNGQLNAGDKVEIYNVAGALVLSVPSTGSGAITINIGHLPAGVYLVKVGDKVGKVVKQ
ncbi:hypothetical protein AGMMS4956_16260 [Bacteroidia bacterium]|nr:hypothetical protein AGMMS4956_16260 [Bacteroidia bacterium]